MNYVTKKDYVLVGIADTEILDEVLNPHWIMGVVRVGTEDDKGTTVFFHDYLPFSNKLVLVKGDDIMVWISKDKPFLDSEVQ